MQLDELIAEYKKSHEGTPENVNDLLDFYQRKYITEEIDIYSYREIFSILHLQGATSAFE